MKTESFIFIKTPRIFFRKKMSSRVTESVRELINHRFDSTVWVVTDKVGRANHLVYGGKSIDGHTTLIKIGERLEPLLMDLARLRYPEGLFPKVIAGHGVTEDEARSYIDEKQKKGKPVERLNSVTILTRLDRVETAKNITEIVESFNESRGRGIRRSSLSRFDQKKLCHVSDYVLDITPLQDEVREVYADLCYYAEKCWNLYEIKISGDMDSSKSQNTLERNIIAPFVALGYKKRKKAFFGVCSSNKTPLSSGEWGGSLGSYLDPEVVLVNEDLFSIISPETITYTVFWDMMEDQLNCLRPEFLSVN